MKEQYQVFEFGNRMIVINREDRSCVGIRKEEEELVQRIFLPLLVWQQH